MSASSIPGRLLGEIRLLRIRVAGAESKLKMLRAQSHEAKRRRKEAKRLAQRARKQYQHSKTEVTELKESLAKAEEKLFKAGGRALARKLAKLRPAAKPRTKNHSIRTSRARQPSALPQSTNLTFQNL